MLLKNYRQFMKNYGKGWSWKVGMFAVASVCAGGMELIGLSLIYPFIAMIMNPIATETNKYYLMLNQITHCNNVLENTLIVGALSVVIFVVKNIFMMIYVHFQNKFIISWRQDIYNQFMRYYLFAPYKTSSKVSFSDKIYNMNTLINSSFSIFILKGLTLITNSIISGMILVMLFVQLPLAALISGGFIVCAVLLQEKILKCKTKIISKKLNDTAMRVNAQLLVNVKNLKEIKIACEEETFYKEYENQQKEFNRVQLKHDFLIGIPPYLTEIFIVLMLFVLIGVSTIINSKNDVNMMASFAIIVAALFRVAPCLNRIQVALNQINLSRDFAKRINEIHDEYNFDEQEKLQKDMKINFNNNILLRNITFSYIEGKNILEDINLDIKKGEFVGIIGRSGEGKTTLADIIMGILPQDSGELLVDGKVIDYKNIMGLRNIVGYVPQEINIVEISVEKNVSFGKPIDRDKIEACLKKAKLEKVGSAGMSQGQKQRLIIARALYREPEIIILDEATSALDLKTEDEITEMLNMLKGKKTIVAIAHRLSTLKMCDRIVFIKNKHIVDVGSFAELSERNEEVKEMIKLSTLQEKFF